MSVIIALSIFFSGSSLAPNAHVQAQDITPMASCALYPQVNGGGGVTWPSGVMSCAGYDNRYIEVYLWRDITAFPDQQFTETWGSDSGYSNYFVASGNAGCYSGSLYTALTGDYRTAQSGRIGGGC